jgi:hypothetical protein
MIANHTYIFIDNIFLTLILFTISLPFESEDQTRLTRNLFIGLKGEDVKAIQQYMTM